MSMGVYLNTTTRLKTFKKKKEPLSMLVFSVCPLDRAADNLPDGSVSADRGEQPAAFPRLLPAQGHRNCIFPRMHYQTVWLFRERLREAGLRPGHDPGPG